MDDLPPKGWQRSIGYDYFLPGRELSLCGKEYRRDGPPFHAEEPAQSCLVCFRKLQALAEQPDLFKEKL
ncbi:hypothetical protein BH10ACI2_BH10ACI2_00460 [soil metagenome]